MGGAEALRSLARVRASSGKASPEFASAILIFVERLITRDGEVIGQRALCPSCLVDTRIIGGKISFVLGCADCGDTGLCCPTCRGAGWVRHAPPHYDAVGSQRIASIRHCPTCATHQTWVGTDGETVSGYRPDGLRVVHALGELFRGEVAA